MVLGIGVRRAFQLIAVVVTPVVTSVSWTGADG
jgi:hypothetical protein